LGFNQLCITESCPVSLLRFRTLHSLNGMGSKKKIRWFDDIGKEEMSNNK
jgi:hypothetical protein